MSKSVVVLKPDDEPVEIAGPIRTLASEANGSDRISFAHEVTDDVVAAKGLVTNGHDELVYIIRGKAEVGFDGKTEIVGPGGFFFIPDGVSWDFKIVETPYEAVGAFSPPLPSGHFKTAHS